MIKRCCLRVIFIGGVCVWTVATLDLGYGREVRTAKTFLALKLGLSDHQTKAPLAGRFEVTTYDSQRKVIDYQSVLIGSDEPSKVIHIPCEGETKIIGSALGYDDEKTIVSAADKWACFAQTERRVEPEVRHATISALRRPSKSPYVYRITFDVGEATLMPKASRTLQRLVKTMKADNGLKVKIQGHSDRLGSLSDHYHLSYQRAMAVKRYLVAAGIDWRRVTVMACGEKRPIKTNLSQQGKTYNRRTEMYLMRYDRL